MPELRVLHPSGTEQRLTLEGGEYIVGRDENADVVLADRKISRRHARLFFKGSSVWIEDLGSANGVMIRGKPIEAPCKLTSTTQVDIGGFLLQLAPEPGSATAHFALIGRSAPFSGRRFALATGSTEVGRTEQSPIAIPEASISRNHARLRVSADGVLVEDLGSSNGTFVNDERVSQAKLRPGDRVRFGHVEFELVASGGPRMPAWVRALWHRARNAERPVQLAMAMAVLSVLLVAVTMVLAGHRAHGRARGLGPGGSLEQAYERAITGGLQAARRFMEQEAWDDALRSYQSVLDRDPIHREARRGARDAQARLGDRAALDAAKAALSGGRPEQALSRLTTVSSQGPYGPLASELIAQARTQAASAALAKAERACRDGDWQQCHEQAALHLEQRPDSAAGQKWLREAEGALRARHIAFVPWVAPEAVGSTADAALTSAYPDPDVRQAVLEYAAGDIDTATKHAAALGTRPSGARLSSLLADFRRAKTAGDGAAATDETERAVREWDSALGVDGAIVPSGQASAFRAELQQRLGIELYRLGSTAFARGKLEDALRHWRAALRYRPQSTDVQDGLKRLASQAEARLKTLPPTAGRDAATCQTLREIVAMTLESMPAGAQARRLAEQCR